MQVRRESFFCWISVFIVKRFAILMRQQVHPTSPPHHHPPFTWNLHTAESVEGSSFEKDSSCDREFPKLAAVLWAFFDPLWYIYCTVSGSSSWSGQSLNRTRMCKVQRVAFRGERSVSRKCEFTMQDLRALRTGLTDTHLNEEMAQALFLSYGWIQRSWCWLCLR